MVVTDNGLPDPDERDVPNDNNRISDDGMIMVNDIDDDESDQDSITLDERDQYQRLPSVSDDRDESSEEEQESFTLPQSTVSSAIPHSPEIIPIDRTLVSEVWSTPPPKSCDIEMDSKKVDEVKQAMVNITLPPEAVPEWAANIPEEEWKQQLIKRLEFIQTRKD